MTQSPQLEQHLIEDYIKANGYGLSAQSETLVRPPVKKTGDIVRDYIAAAGYGLKKPE